MNLPKIRENLLVQELKDEVLIFDRSTNKSYCLNETAKIVFNACDGVKTFADVSLPEDIIYLSLDELKKNNLIQDSCVSPFEGMNRREVIRRVGLASMVALPVISSLIAPSAINAASSCRVNPIQPNGQGTCPTNQRCVNSSCVPCRTTGQTGSFTDVSNTFREICEGSRYRDDYCCSATSRGTFSAPSTCNNIVCT